MHIPIEHILGVILDNSTHIIIILNFIAQY